MTPDGWGYVGNPKGTRERVIVQIIWSDGYSIEGYPPADVHGIADSLRDIASEVDDGRTERAYQALHDLAERIEANAP